MKRILFLIAFLLFAVPAWATNWYVAVTGTDTYGGSHGDISHPFLTPQFARTNPSLACGDTIFIRQGTYSGGMGNNYGRDTTCASYASQVIVQNYPGEVVTWSKPAGDFQLLAFTGDDYPNLHDIYMTVQGTTLGSFVFDMTGNLHSAITDNCANHVRLINIEIVNSWTNGIFADCSNGTNGDPDHAPIDFSLTNVKIHDGGHCYDTLSCQSPLGFYLGISGSTLDGVEVYNYPGCGQMTNSGSQALDNNIIKNGNFHDCPVSGAIFSNGDNYLIYNNQAYNNGGYCLSIGGSGNTAGSALYNNSVTQCGNGIIVGTGATGTSVVSGNISYGNTSTDIVNLVTSGTAQISYNLTGNGIGGGGNQVLTGNTTGNPLWSSTSVPYDFTLSTCTMNSACNLATNNTAIFTTDRAGVTRPSMGTTGVWEAGAYEFNGGGGCTPAKLGALNQPSSTTIGASLGTVAVEILSSGNVRCTSATNAVTFAKGGGATWNSLQVSSGSLVINPIGGVAAISTMFVYPTTGSGTITAAASGLTGVTLDSITISAAAAPCGGVYMGCTLYVDFVGGDDTFSGADKNHPWKHAPGMTGQGTNPATLDVDDLDLSGLSIIFKGGVTIARAAFQWTIRGKGTGATVGTTAYYMGVDPSWFTGGSWARPIINLGGIGAGAFCNTAVSYSPAGYRIFDNFEFTGLYTDSGCNSSVVGYIQPRTGGHNEFKNLYMHGVTHASAGSGAGDVCWMMAGDSQGIDSTTSVHDSVFEDETHPAFGSRACNGLRGNPPIAYSNYFGYLTTALDPTGGMAYYGNTADHIGGSFASEHDQFYQDNGSDHDTFVYNNLAKDSHAGQGILGGSRFGFTTYIFNNVFYADEFGTLLITCGDTNHSATAGNCLIYNNTIADSFSTLQVGCGYYSSGPASGSPALQSCKYKNNHIITDQSSILASCTNVAGMGTCTQDHNTVQTFSAATSNGFTSGSAPPYFPTTALADTIAAGTTLASLCGGPYLTALCTTSTAGVNYDATNHVILGPGDPSAVVRDWTTLKNTGAYQFNASAPLLSSLSPNAGVRGSSLLDVMFTGITTAWTVDSVPAITGLTAPLYWTFYDSAHILATFGIALDAVLGAHDATVTTDAHTDTLTNGFTVTNQITTVTPVFAGKFWKR